MNKEETKALLKRAKKLAPHNDFVRSCAKFFKTKGFLSSKQITAVERVISVEYEDRHDELDYGDSMGLDPADLFNWYNE